MRAREIKDHQDLTVWFEENLKGQRSDFQERQMRHLYSRTAIRYFVFIGFEAARNRDDYWHLLFCLLFLRSTSGLAPEVLRMMKVSWEDAANRLRDRAAEIRKPPFENGGGEIEEMDSDLFNAGASIFEMGAHYASFPKASSATVFAQILRLSQLDYYPHIAHNTPAASGRFVDRILEDLVLIEAGHQLDETPIMSNVEQTQYLLKRFDQLHTARQNISNNPDENLDFWREWFLRILEGHKSHADLLSSVIAGLKVEDWVKGPSHINPMFDQVLDLYRNGERTKLSEAFVFSFEALDRVMRIIGIEDDCAHLREPKVVQRFVDDTAELRDVFDEFVEDARTLTSSQGHGGVAQKAAQSVLNELHRAKNDGHIRARYLVGACKKLERRAKDPETRAELGGVASGDLDDAIGLMKDVCRRHFGPSYAAFAPLAQLSFDQVDKDQVIRLVDQALDRIKNADGEELAQLHEDDLPLLESMVQELHDLRVQILSINDDAFRGVLEQQLAQEVGSVSITLGHFVEKSLEVLPQPGKAIDEAGKQLKRVKTTQDIVEVLEKIGIGS